jgi:hypothetical protein
MHVTRSDVTVRHSAIGPGAAARARHTEGGAVTKRGRFLASLRLRGGCIITMIATRSDGPARIGFFEELRHWLPEVGKKKLS